MTAESPAEESAPETRAPLALRLALVALGVLGLCLGYRQVTSPDLGFHLATARWILENGDDILRFYPPGAELLLRQADFARR